LNVIFVYNKLYSVYVLLVIAHAKSREKLV